MLADVDIADAIAEAQAKRSERTKLSQDWIVGRLKDNVERAMTNVEVIDREGNGVGEFTYQGSVANKALELLGRHLGMFTDKIKVGGDSELMAMLKEVNGRTRGLPKDQ